MELEFSINNLIMIFASEEKNHREGNEQDHFKSKD